MIETIYIEEAIHRHPRAQTILARFPKARKITCQRYGEVFNPKSQNFRLQKRKPALILAEKYKNPVLPAPPGYGVGSKHNYYFSHMLNCLYDCRYCFLQGMFQSANYVLFVNYETFQKQISEIANATPEQEIHFFSGYDCDSLALEPVTGFVEAFLPVFRNHANAWLELRTKSTQIRSLLDTEPLSNCIVAFSFTPEVIAKHIEHRAPNIQKRLEAMEKLQQAGWPLGLRFDPMIYQPDYQNQYQALFKKIFARLDKESIHSVSLGSFRLPEKFFTKLDKLYPEEKLFAGPLEKSNGMVSYESTLEHDMFTFCSEELLKYISPRKFYPCTVGQ